MKVIAVLANTNKKSRAGKVAAAILAGAEEAGHQVTVYDLTDMPLLGCENCHVCRNMNCNCVRPDGIKPYFDDLCDADVVVIAAPNYNSQPSGSMITFLNRHYCLLDQNKQPRLDHDIRLISVFAQGAPTSYTAYGEHYQWYLGCFKTKRLIADEPIIIGGDSNLDENGDVLKNAYAIGHDL